MGKKVCHADLKSLADLKARIDSDTEKYKKLKEKILKEMIDNSIDCIRDIEFDSLTATCKRVNNRVFNIETVKAILGSAASKCIKEEIQAKAFDEVVKERGIKNPESCFTTIPGSPQFVWGGLEEYITNRKVEAKTK